MMHRLLTKTRSLNTTRRMTIPAGSRFFRILFSTAPSFTPENPPIRRLEFSNHNLYSRLSLVRSTGEKASDVLDQIYNNNQLKREDLVQCILMLCKDGHYQLCLEILEWMEKGQIGHSALHLSMICEVKGIDEAEEFFYSLPPDEHNRATCGALLHGYCFKKMIDKALALFNKMDGMNFVSSEVAYAHLISLYMKVDQPEKVPPLIQEMKQRNIPISCVCYQPWILSYACLNDREGIEEVIKEVRLQRSIKDEWLIYITFASAYLKTDQFEKADQILILLEEILDNSFDNLDYVGYHVLINLYASLSRLEAVNRIWEKLKSRSDDYDNLCYLTMLQALTKLGNMELLKKCFMEWNSNYKSYDARLLTVVIGAFLRHDWFEEANLILKDAADGGGDKACAAHVTFMDYYLEKRQIDLALKHLEVALANQWVWHSFAGKLNRFFEYFIEEKDVDGAEKYCEILERSQPLVPATYLGLLRTYAAAGKTAPDMCKRMEQSAINIGTELEELLEKVCPN
ncbi:pentatricopeptide repeat-containing protein At1g02370, mitochondrial-like [Chenopodium quinoa]|nr:pentatricopeptide repeat-containing protein At1g02370, mitochondrial-like [Chenopodium quinoa]